MILRRVIAHFRKQEWTAIFLDFVIVVVGVFVGIQVSNWNAARLTDIRGADYEQRLKVDLKEEYWVYSYVDAYVEEVLANARRAAAALEDREPLSDEAFVISAYRATQFKVRSRRRATYDELTSTGEIGLIRDRTLRETAMSVYSTTLFDRISSQGVQSRFREIFRMTTPTAVQRALRIQCGDIPVTRGDFSGIARTLDYPCTTGLDAATISAAASALRTDPALLPALRLRVADLETQLVDLRMNNKDMVEGLRAVSESGK